MFSKERAAKIQLKFCLLAFQIIASASSNLTAIEDFEIPINGSAEAATGNETEVRSGRDLLYESMKMRTGNWKPRSPDDEVCALYLS